MSKKDDTIKTNVMRILDKAGIAYETRSYEYSEDDLSGTHAADTLGLAYETVYKTLVLRGAKNGCFVCVIPVDREIDLKKAAKVFGDKSADMIHVKELMPLTGYIRGGCSPIGMKKKYPTFIQEDAQMQNVISISAGQRGVQVILDPSELCKLVNASFADVIVN